MKPLVYIAGPYTHTDPVLNVRAAVTFADLLIDEDAATPLVPHLTHLWHLIRPRPYDEWVDYDLELLDRCDALVRLPGDSPGADREYQRAAAKGLAVFRGPDLDGRVVRWARMWTANHATEAVS